MFFVLYMRRSDKILNLNKGIIKKNFYECRAYESPESVDEKSLSQAMSRKKIKKNSCI